MNSSDLLLAAPRDRKLFSGPRPGLVSLMDLGHQSRGAEVQGFRSMARPRQSPEAGVQDTRGLRVMSVNTLPASAWALPHGCAFQGKASFNSLSRAGRGRLGPQGTAGLGSTIWNSQVNKLFPLNYSKGKNK